MNPDVRRALRDGIEARKQSRLRGAVGILDISSDTGLGNMKVTTLSGGQGQLTIPKEVRARWTVGIQKLEIFGIYSHEALLILPRSSARTWQRNNPGKSQSLTLSTNGQISVPKRIQNAWGDKRVACVDLGYCFFVAPPQVAGRVLEGIRSPNLKNPLDLESPDTSADES